MMLSIVIPAYREPYLNKTIDSILEGAVGDIEVIPVIDGYRLDEPLSKDSRVKPIFFERNKGMRKAFNAGLEKAVGWFLMKCDGHCAFAPGFDGVLAKDCAVNWLVIPRRYSLYVDGWRRDERMTIKDYHYLAFPVPSKYGLGLYPQEWRSRTDERMNDDRYLIDETMTMQGSCWFANREYFMERVGFLDDRQETYTSFSGEPLEVGLKYWLGGGAVMVNKKTWYAHLFKNKRYYQEHPQVTRFHKRHRDTIRSHTWAAKHWINNEELGMSHRFEWLLEKFWPIPTWTDGWWKKWEAYGDEDRAL